MSTFVRGVALDECCQCCLVSWASLNAKAVDQVDVLKRAGLSIFVCESKAFATIVEFNHK